MVCFESSVKITSTGTSAELIAEMNDIAPEIRLSILWPRFFAKPAGMAKKRGHKIDKRISGAMSFISAMSSADVPVDVIFTELSKQTIYGEVAQQAERMTRNTVT